MLVLALVTRISIATILNDNIEQVSDFRNALKTAETLEFNEYYHGFFTHWILLPKITNILFQIFGNSQLVALIFNGIVCSVSALLVYLISNVITKNKNISLLASLIFILWPANILYVVIYTPEHITQLLILLSIYLIYKGLDKFDKNIINIATPKRQFIFACLLFFLAGGLLGLTTFFKNFGIVFVIALFIYFVLDIIFNKCKLKEYVTKHIIAFIMVSIGSILITQITYIYLDNIVGKKVSRNNMAYFLTIGLNSKNDGTYNTEIAEEYINQLKESDYNYALVNEQKINELIEDIKHNNKLFDLLKNKAKIVAQNDESRLDFVQSSANRNGSSKTAEIIENVKKFNNFYYMFIWILIGIGILRFREQINLKILFLYIGIYGSYLLLVIIEAQNRYQYAINPILCILAALGFEVLLGHKEREQYLLKESNNS